jgi:hypothetical protein
MLLPLLPARHFPPLLLLVTELRLVRFVCCCNGCYCLALLAQQTAAQRSLAAAAPLQACLHPRCCHLLLPLLLLLLLPLEYAAA